MLVVAYFVLILSLINLMRIGFFSLFSDLFDIKHKKKSKNHTKKQYSENYNPLVSVLVPAHNEEVTLRRNLESIAASDYNNIELIIINDSSTDRTYHIARYFQRQYRNRFKKIRLLNVNVRGKARALNAGLKKANGSLFMCLDADSALTADAITQSVQTFRNPEFGALSSNVKIFPTSGLLNNIQRIEYLLCYQMKKAETTSNIQYIVGGIGSMFRMRLIRAMNGYDTDTITEDIDLSMQMIEQFNGRYKISYNPNVVVYTESVMNISGLITQRYRWKLGRYQVFLKRKSLFMNHETSGSKLLSWVYLPFALFSEFTYALEPLVVGFVISLIVLYGDTTMLLASFATYLFYTIYLINGATQSYSRKERLRLSLYAPIAYIGMYVLAFVEYLATVKGLYKLPGLMKSFRHGDTGGCEWTPVTRSGITKV